MISAGRQGLAADLNGDTLGDILDVFGYEWVAVFVYLDETNVTGSPKQLAAVGGYLFSRDAVKEFQSRFMTELAPILPPDKNGQRIFHAAQCVGGYEQFAGLSELVRQGFVNKMVELISSTVTMGYVVGLEPVVQHQTLARSEVLRDTVGSPYSACLLQCAQGIAGWMNAHGLTSELHYVLEGGCQHQDEASDMLHKMHRAPTSIRRNYHFRGHTFEPKCEAISPLCAADLLAWECQRADVNVNNRYRHEWRQTIGDLRAGRPHVIEYFTTASIMMRFMINKQSGLG